MPSTVGFGVGILAKPAAFLGHDRLVLREDDQNELAQRYEVLAIRLIARCRELVIDGGQERVCPEVSVHPLRVPEILRLMLLCQ